MDWTTNDLEMKNQHSRKSRYEHLIWYDRYEHHLKGKDLHWASLERYRKNEQNAVTVTVCYIVFSVPGVDTGGGTEKDVTARCHSEDKEFTKAPNLKTI